jgi:CubicO group peptidase (beta-lactamase class C family)
VRVRRRIIPVVTSPLDLRRLQPAFDLVGGQVRSGLIPSAVLAVANAAGPLRVEAFPGDSRATTDSIYQIASITKPIVATAVMQLVERGLLDLQAPVQRVVPEFIAPPSGPGLPGAEAVTTWHLLTHTSGVADLDNELLARERPDRAAMLDRVCRTPLSFVPGSRFDYNSLSFALLGEIIRRLDGRDYPDYLRAQILEPLGMADTAFSPTDRARAVRSAFPNIPAPLQAFASKYFDSLQLPGGGLWGTAADLLRFGRAMLGGGRLGDAQVLGSPVLAEMTRDQTVGLVEPGPPPTMVHYGLGWGLPGLTRQTTASSRAFGHGGATGTRLLIDPDADLVVVYLANRWGAGDEPSLAAVQAVLTALAD